MTGAYKVTMVLLKKEPALYTKIIGKARQYERSDMQVKESKNRITISITANDLAAMKASINSVMRDLQTLENVVGSLPAPTSGMSDR